MRIVVTGSAGHLGEGLVRTLRDGGHEVLGINRCEGLPPRARCLSVPSGACDRVMLSNAAPRDAHQPLTALDAFMLSQARRPSDAEQPFEFFRALNACAAGPSSDLTSVLERLVERLGWDWYAVWIKPPRAMRLECVVAWARRTEGDPTPPAVGERRRPGEGVAGRAWKGSIDVGSANGGSRVGVAVRVGGEATAVFEFGLPMSPPEVPAELMSVLIESGEAAFAYLYLAHRHTLAPAPLNVREQQVLQWAAEGFSLPSIAALLDISEAVVKSHFENLYLKLGVSDRAGAVAQGFRRDLLR